MFQQKRSIAKNRRLRVKLKTIQSKQNEQNFKTKKLKQQKIKTTIAVKVLGNTHNFLLKKYY